jgi:hypothetical protein
VTLTLKNPTHALLFATGAGLLETNAGALRDHFERLVQDHTTWPAQVDLAPLLPLLEAIDFTTRQLGRELERASRPTRSGPKTGTKSKKTRKVSAK